MTQSYKSWGYKQKKATDSVASIRYPKRTLRYPEECYASAEIAPVGQASAQEPQSMQTSGLIEYTSPSLIAPVGQTPWQVPQATHTSGEILCAIVSYV